MTETSTRTVIGIDPASGSKGSYVFCPARNLDKKMDVPDLRKKLRQWAAESVLVCWDAPLTGPEDPSGAGDPGSLTQREVETQLAKLIKKAPGVTVRGFSGLTHWTVTRHLLGLPRVGPYDLPEEDLPLKLVFRRDDLEPGRGAVAEVHPTPAAWLWRTETGADWLPYKGAKDCETDNWEATKRARVSTMWQALIARHAPGLQDEKAHALPSDDAFDARIAWLLGRIWLDEGGVRMWGTREDGAMLMPASIGPWPP